MGDRANIIVKQGGDRAPVWLYTHWGGHGLPTVLQDALKRKQRWEDAAYLTRIIFCHMIDGDTEGETGFGISTGPCDNEHDYLVVDPDEQTVSLSGYNWREHEGDPLSAVKTRWTFAEFIKLKFDEDAAAEQLDPNWKEEE